jgi:hypothetical protein
MPIVAEGKLCQFDAPFAQAPLDRRHFPLYMAVLLVAEADDGSIVKEHYGSASGRQVGGMGRHAWREPWSRPEGERIVHLVELQRGISVAMPLISTPSGWFEAPFTTGVPGSSSR